MERPALATRCGSWHNRHDFAPAGTRRRENPWMAKIVRDGLFGFFATLANDPQHHEQGHHRRDKIGVGHLPRAPVVSTVSFLHNLLNDRYCLTMYFCHTASFLVP